MGPKLRIIAINDVYVLENLPRLKSLVKHHTERDAADVTLVTLAGDFVAPSVLSSLDGGRGMIACMNAVGVTHAILGNHEDDIPTPELHARIGELEGTMLGTNTRAFDPKMKPCAVIEVRGAETRTVRVGLLGVVMTDPTIYRRPPFGGTKLVDANEAAVLESERLRREDHCATVIPLTHQTLVDDTALVLAERKPPFPVLIGGHEHEVHLQQLEGTWIVKAEADAVHAVIVDLVWPEAAPAAGEVDFPTVAVRVDDVAHYPEDADLRAMVTRLMARVHELEAAVLVELPAGEALSSIGTRVRQTSVGALLASKIRDALGAEACFVNGGGVRGSREYRGRFTYGDLKAEVPFENEVVVVPLPGHLVAEALRASRAHAPEPAGGFLQVDDRLLVDGENHPLYLAGAPFDPQRTYQVAIVRNLLLGLDHIEPLARFGLEERARLPAEGSGRDIKVVLVDAFARELWQHLGAFASVDTNHDGAVTAGELRDALARLGDAGSARVVGDLVLHALDTNRDGAISSGEAEEDPPTKR